MDVQAVGDTVDRFDFSQLFETELAMFSVAGPDGYFRNVNPAFERLLGRSRQQLLEHSLFEFVLPADIPKALQGLYELDAGLREVAFETRWTHADGSVRWLAWVARRDARAEHWYATARDVTEYREMQAALEQVQQRLSLAMSVAQAGSWDWNADESRMTLDASTELLFALPPGRGQSGVRELLRHVHRGDWQRLVDLLRDPNREDRLDTDFRLRDESQGTRYIALRGRVVARDRRGKAQRAVGIAFDATHQKALEEQLLALVMHDPLTGVRNRRSFDQTLRSEWRRGLRTGRPLSVLMIDVDEFKRYNDRYGHQGGDDALCAVARAIGGAVDASTDLVARYGGEEFVALLPGADAAQAGRVAGRVLAAVRDLRLAHAEALHGIVTVSIGQATVLVDAAGKSQNLVGAADRALYAAKQAGRNTAAG